jgi:hypothetical protein
MVLYSFVDRERPIQLLHQNQTRELVRERQSTEREPKVAGVENRSIKSEIGSDDENERPRPVVTLTH